MISTITYRWGGRGAVFLEFDGGRAGEGLLASGRRKPDSFQTPLVPFWCRSALTKSRARPEVVSSRRSGTTRRVSSPSFSSSGTAWARWRSAVVCSVSAAFLGRFRGRGGSPECALFNALGPCVPWALISILRLPLRRLALFRRFRSRLRPAHHASRSEVFALSWHTFVPEPTEWTKVEREWKEDGDDYGEH